MRTLEKGLMVLASVATEELEMRTWLRVIYGAFGLAATYARFGPGWIDSDDYLTIIALLVVFSGIAELLVRRRGR